MLVGNYLSKTKEDNPCLKTGLCVKQNGVTFERMGIFSCGFPQNDPLNNYYRRC